MTETTDKIDELYQKAVAGEPRVIRYAVSSDLEVEVRPADDVHKAGLIKLIENEDEGEVVIFPSEVKRLIDVLSQAATTLAEWRARQPVE